MTDWHSVVNEIERNMVGAVLDLKCKDCTFSSKSLTDALQHEIDYTGHEVYEN